MSIYKLKGGEWKVTVSYKSPTTGKYRRLCGRAKTRKAAIQVESLLQIKAKKTKDGDELPFSSVVEDFLDYSRETRRLVTIQEYSKLCRLFLVPYFGDKPIGSITEEDVREWKKTLLKAKSEKTGKPYTVCYLNHIWKTFRLVMSYAKKFGVENRAASLVTSFKDDPNAITKETVLHYWTPSELERFNTAIDEEIKRFDTSDPSFLTYSATKILVNICFFSGLRKGEANALKVSDVHFGKYPYISVRKSVSQKLGISEYVTTNPKSKTSIRDVAMPKFLVNLLRYHIDQVLSRLPSRYKSDPYLTYGYSPLADTTAQSIKDKVEKKADLPHIRIHDLRHSYASMLINTGIDINTLAKLLGHSTPGITFRIYSHLYPKTTSEAVTKIDSIFDK